MTGILLASIIIAYAVFVLILWLGWEKASPFESTEKAGRPLSILIAVRNESANIENLLTNIENQDYPLDKIEVIIVDDHSTDNTVDKIASYIQKSPLNIQLQALSIGKGKKSALHQGILQSSHDLILTTDGDCRAGTKWVESMVSIFDRAEVQMVSGPVRIYPQESLFSRLQAHEFAALVSSGAATIAYGWPTMANGANLAFRKDTYHQVSERYEKSASGDDVFLLHKISEKYPGGISFCKDKYAIIDTPASESIQSFYQQRKRWATKWSEYRHWPTKLLAMVIFLVNFSVIILPFAAGLNLITWVMAANLFVVKFVFEFWFIRTVQNFFNADFRFHEFVILALLYPLYVVYTAIAGLFGKYEWKGRKTI